VCHALLLGYEKQDEELLYHKVNGEPIELKIDYGEKYEPVKLFSSSWEKTSRNEG